MVAPQRGLCRNVPYWQLPVARAVGAVVVSPALQRGVSVPTKTEPESRRDGAFSVRR
jgi:hypothetical protein